TKSWLDTLIKNDSDHQAIGFSIKDYEFAVYLRYKGYQPTNPPAQEYLDVVYPQRQAITELNLNNEKLTGSLDLSDFVNLKELDCSENYLTNLNLNNCLQLKTINCSDNNLQQDLSFVINLKQLKELKIYNTNFNAVNIDQLPRSLEEIKYFSDSPITSQLAPIRYEQDLAQSSGQELAEKFIQQQKDNYKDLK
ncbi:2629_t:CDS:2, partial [Racocetra persica]